MVSEKPQANKTWVVTGADPGIFGRGVQTLLKKKNE